MLLTMTLITCVVLTMLIAGLSVLQWALQERRTAREIRELSAVLREFTAREHTDTPLLLETLQQDLFTRRADTRPRRGRRRQAR